MPVIINGSNTPTAGSVGYGNGTELAFTAAGTSGQVLTSSGSGAPTWSAISSVSVTSISFGTTGLTPSTATQGNVTVSGTLAVANGGTGLTALGTGITSWLATPSSANLAAAVTDETGSGALVFGTSPTIATPTITTSATAPLVIGGTGTTSTLTLRSTSGVGTTGADIIFQAGNNGATEIMRLRNNGNVGIGTNSPSSPLTVFAPNNQAALMVTNGPSANNVGITLEATNGNVVLNNGNGPLEVAVGGGTRMVVTTSGNVGIGTASPATSLDVTGSITASGTGRRLLADMSNATVANRFAVQSSTTNGETRLHIIPNGTASISGFSLETDSAITNGQFGQVLIGTSAMLFLSGQRGTGGYVPIVFNAGGSDRLRIATDGAVGVGVTPASWDGTWNALQVGATGSLFSNTGNTLLTNNTYNNSGNKYITTGTAGAYLIGGNAHYWYTAPSGTAGNTISFTQAMTLDASGNLGVGATTMGARLDVAGASSDTLRLRNASGASEYYRMGRNTGDGLLDFYGTQSGFIGYRFGGADGTRMVVNATGEVFIAGTTDQGAYNLQCNGTGVWGAGAYVNGSDERLKENIKPLADGLEVVKNLRAVTFQYKQTHSKDTDIQPGFIAQELQTALAGKDYINGIVKAGPEYLNVAYQSIIPILVKAIQEQQSQIESLKSSMSQLIKG